MRRWRGLWGIVLLVVWSSIAGCSTPTPQPQPLPSRGKDVTVAGTHGTYLRWAYAVPTSDSSSYADAIANLGSLDVVMPAYYTLHATGSIGGNDNSTLTVAAHRAGVKVVPMVKNSDAELDDFHTIMADAAGRARVIGQIAALVNQYRYDGINIDWENLNADDRPLLTAFMTELRDVLHKSGALVTQALVAKHNDGTQGYSGAYDYTALAPLTDYAIIMCYDYTTAGTKGGGAGAPVQWIRQVLNYATEVIPRSKIVLGLPFYGRVWDVTTNAAADGYSLTAAKAAALATQYPDSYTSGYDADNAENWAHFSHDGHDYVAWYQSPRSFADKLAPMQQTHIGGFAGWRLGHETPDFWAVPPAK